MLTGSCLQPCLKPSPLLHRRQSPHEPIPARSAQIKTTPPLPLYRTTIERKPMPAKPYTLKMKHLLDSNKLADAKDLFIETALKGNEPGVILGSILIENLMKSGFVLDAFQVFERMPERNVITWASMMLGCVRNCLQQDSFYLFINMLESGATPNDYSYNAALRACTELCSLSLGEQMHSLIVRSGFMDDCGIGNSLIEFYSRCGFMDKAARIFYGILELDLVSYTSMISGFCRNKCFGSAAGLFCQMVSVGMEPNEHTISSILTACGPLLGEQIHGYVIKSLIEESVFSAGCLIEFYSRNNKIKEAKLVFEKMENRNVVTWSSMISCCLQHDRAQDALSLFARMITEGIQPNEITFSTAITAHGLCPDPENINLGHQLHALSIKLNFNEADNWICNALLTMYAHMGEVDELDKLLDKNEDSDIVSWCAAISGYFQNGFYERSAGLLCEMHSKGLKPNEYGFSSVISSCANLPLIDQGRQFHCLALKSGCDLNFCVGNALINLYAKCGYLDDARLAFDIMPAHDVVSWNSLIHGYSYHGFGRKSIELFEEMVASESCLPNHSTFLGILVGCNHVGCVYEANKYFMIMYDNYGLVPSSSHYACMVDIMGRAGKLVEALRVIEQMPYEPDALIWKSLSGSCRLHRNMELGKLAAGKVIELSPEDSAGYILLSNLHSMHGEWEKAERVRSAMKEKGVRKEAGWSWIEIRNEVNAFHASDESHSKAELIFQILKELYGIMKEEA